MRLKIRMKKHNATPVLQLEGNATGEDVRKISQRMSILSEGDFSTVVIDLSELETVDSNGLGVFVFSWKLLQSKSKRLLFFDPRGFVKELFEGAAFDKVLPHYRFAGGVVSLPASKSSQKQLRKPRSNKNLRAFKPQMTSLIDLMTVIIIFLLQSFSTEGQIITVSSDLTLPASSARKPPELTVNVIVTDKYIMAETDKVATVAEVLGSDDLVVPQLGEWLRQRREMTEDIAKYSSKTAFTGTVTIQADKRIHFRLLKKIMYTCGRQGFNNFAFAVESTSE